MPRIYTTTPGQVVSIGNHGVATNDTPCIVPDEVAEELERDMRGEKAIEGRPARAGMGPIYRIEREGKAAPRLSASDVKDAQKVKE